jgi:hypothetical protein
MAGSRNCVNDVQKYLEHSSRIWHTVNIVHTHGEWNVQALAYANSPLIEIDRTKPHQACPPAADRRP